MMHTISEARSSSTQTSMTKRPALVIIHSEIQQACSVGWFAGSSLAKWAEWLGQDS
jgi:hypothetical protein